MKILLINPPRSPHNAILEHAPGETRRFIHKKLIGPPLGLITVAAAVRDHDVVVLDMKGEYDLDPDAPPPAELAVRWLAEHRPSIVGITVIASEFPSSMEILRAIRRADPDVLTVAGGLHATLCPRDFERPEVDVVCPGQAAHVFRALVEARSRGSSLDSVRGLYVNGPNGLRWTGDWPEEINPATTGFIMPERRLLARWLSTYRVGAAPGPVTYLFTSLGCPYRCSFCSIWPQFGGRFYQRDVESVIKELKSIPEYPVVRFADANTVVDTNFVEHLLDRIEQEGIRKEYVMDLRADTAARYPRLIERLARVGLKVVICGFESHRREELERYNKSCDAALVTEAIRVLNANGIAVRGNYVIPPDYSEPDFASLADYASRNPVTYAGYTILTPMPGTRLYEELTDEIVDFDLSKYNFFNCVLRTRLPRERFYEQMAMLWPIKKGLEVI